MQIWSNKVDLLAPFKFQKIPLIEGFWANSYEVLLVRPYDWYGKVSVTGHLYTVSKSLERITEKTGLPIRLHDLRRTFVSVANSIRIPYYTIKRLVNHSSGGDVTASVYNVMDVDDLREPMQAITDEFKKLMGGML